MIWSLARLALLTAFAITSVVATAEQRNAPQPRRELASVPGVRLWFTDTGGTGEPIVLMHAITGTSESWAPQIDAFSRAGYRVIAFDRRGWGRSETDAATGPQPGMQLTIFTRSPTISRSDDFISWVSRAADSSRSTTRQRILNGCPASSSGPAPAP